MTDFITKFIQTGEINDLKVGKVFTLKLDELLECSERYENKQPMGYMIILQGFCIDIFVCEEKIITSIILKINQENKEFSVLFKEGNIKLENLNLRKIVKFLNESNLEWEFMKPFADHSIIVRVIKFNVDIIFQYENLEQLEVLHLKAF